MDKFIQWMKKKKAVLDLESCAEFEIRREESDVCFGGFKEYKPPIYERDYSISSQTIITDLIIDHTPKKPVNA